MAFRQQAAARALVVALAALPAAGCGAGDAPPPAARPYPDSGRVEADGVRLHYALTPTMDLAPEIAGSYGILQRPNLALLTIAFSAAGRADGARPEPGAPAATAVTLTGMRQPLALRRRDSATGPSWLATLEFRDREPVTIEIEARSAPGGAPLSARFTRAFPID